MLRRVAALAVLMAAPAVLGAQSSIPNENANQTAKDRVAANRPTLPTLPEQASQTAKDRLAELQTLWIQGSVVSIQQGPASRATPASPSTGARPSTVENGGPPTEKPPVTIAIPASPSQKPESPGQSGNHRP